MQEKKDREIFENSQAGIFTFDIGTQMILTLNQQLADLLGYTIDELKNLLFASLWFDNVTETKFPKKIRQDLKISNMEIALRKKDRMIIWVLATAFMTKEGLVICSAVDITESSGSRMNSSSPNSITGRCLTGRTTRSSSTIWMAGFSRPTRSPPAS